MSAPRCITLGREARERLWARVKAKAGGSPPNEAMRKKYPATQWVKPGVRATVKHLRGEEFLRHGSVTGLTDE